MTDPIVNSFWDRTTGSWQYVFHDPETMKGAIVDPVLDYDPKAGATSHENARLILEHVRANGIEVEWVLDTHPHADHFSAAAWLADELGAKQGIGEEVLKVQRLWKEIYNLEAFEPTDVFWDRMFADGDSFKIGNLEVKVLFSPGHTLASVTYVVGDAAFVHDTFMMPDSGTSRADFPGGSSKDLYETLQKILALPDETRLFVGHDYAPGDRGAECCATVAEHKASNKHLKDKPSEVAYREVRDARDATLPLPDLMLEALQVNIRGGRLPEAESDGRSYLKIPVNYFEPR
ncbi:MAG TPA: MBL fold metallo-hydrolase [Maritimibacter sp.]|nr:MBL fold metallo-hydrolase [Maritimibacter sp.]